MVFAIGSLLGLVSCQNKSSPSAPPSQESLYDRGKVVFISRCIACHNLNPKLDGPVGPALNGSSIELLKTKVLNANYPADYKPKRETTLMVPLPDLDKEIPGLHAYLNDLK